MRTKLTVAGLLALTLSGCATNDPIYGADTGYYDDGYYGDSYYGDGYYRDPAYGGYYTPNSSVFYGSIFVGGSWYDGPHRYREGRLGREYWFRNGWHRAQIRPAPEGRGPRNNFGPGQWQDRNPQGTGNAVTPPPRNPGRDIRQNNRPRADANAQTPVPNPTIGPLPGVNRYRGDRVAAPNPPRTDPSSADRPPRGLGDIPTRVRGAAGAAAATIRARQRDNMSDREGE